MKQILLIIAVVMGQSVLGQENKPLPPALEQEEDATVTSAQEKTDAFKSVVQESQWVQKVKSRGSGCLILIVGLAAILLSYRGILYWNKKSKEQLAKLAEAKSVYDSALEELEENNSTENKKSALEKGREYAALSREAQGMMRKVALFDEVALTNDINARIKEE